MSGKLYVVATPIGNLSDITLRALETLKLADVIACEDTRHTLVLLNHYNIKKPLISYHQHSGAAKKQKIIEMLTEGENIALVTDAGTPGISDPGEILIMEAIKEGITVEPIPGCSAVISALSISGISTNEFIFYGFLPHKKGRQTKLKEIADVKKTVVLYESPYRIKKLMGEILEYCGDREIAICRELTKKFETVYRGKVSEVTEKIKEKGEFVVIIEGSNE
jgi:16S rRNA (cytidine1402-2'-O)-methyltransferase